jgi:type II secretory pathway pseudopilin PulG
MDAPDKPKPPSNPPAPPSTTPSGAYISPKLREKLMSTDDTEWTPKNSSPVPLVIGVIVVLAAGAFGVSALRSASHKRQEAEQAAAAKATADSLVAVARAESLAAIADSSRADSSLAGGTPAKPGAIAKPSLAPKPASPAGGATAGGTKPAAPAGAPPKAEAGPFGIAVGPSYLFEDKANTEKDGLAAKTSLAGRVRTVKEGGAEMYQVVLGSFPSRAAAQAKADELTGQGAIEQARVVPLPK